MKTLQKATLAAAIAAAPFFATNALEALDDETLSNMTGQAGVTIETTVDDRGITIGSIEYTDTLGKDAVDGEDGEIGGGSLAITKGDYANGIKVIGATKNADGTYSADANITKQTIDIDSKGNLVTATENLSDNFKQITIGNVELRATGKSSGASLASNLVLTQKEGNSAAHILNLTEGQAGLTSYTINGISSDESDATTVEFNTNGANLAIVTDSESRIENLDVDALDGAIQVRGLKYGLGDDAEGMMRSTQVIWAKSGSASDGGGVYIQGSSSEGTLIIGSVGIGGASIGSVKITDINQAGSTQRIYGH